MDDVTVACVLRSGGEFRPEHVARLKAMCERFVPHERFVCLSDVEVPCERIELLHAWPRWWGKCELFRPKLLDGPTLYFDLDTTITAPFSVPLKVGDFWMLRDFYEYERRGKSTPASGVMAWHGRFTAIYESLRVRSSPPTAAEWDQRHIAQFVRAKLLQAHLPGIYSYKAHIRGKPMPADARVICYHGQPRPWAVEEAA